MEEGAKGEVNRLPFLEFSTSFPPVFPRKADIMEHTLIIERKESAEKRCSLGGRRENELKPSQKINRLPFLEFPTDFRHRPGK